MSTTTNNTISELLEHYSKHNTVYIENVLVTYCFTEYNLLTNSIVNTDILLIFLFCF